MNDHRIQSKDLVAQLATRRSDRNSHPRALLRSWLGRTATVSAGNAFRVGEALRALGVGWSCGPLALFAAGHYADFLSAIRALWMSESPSTVEFALGLLVDSQLLVPFDVFAGFQEARAMRVTSFSQEYERKWQGVRQLPEVVASIRRRFAHALAGGAATSFAAERLLKKSQCLRMTQDRQRLDDLYMQPAITMLSSKADPELAWKASWVLLSFWLDQAFPVIRFESKSFDSSLQLWGEAPILAAVRGNGRLIYGSPINEDAGLLEVIELAISAELAAPVMRARRLQSTT